MNVYLTNTTKKHNSTLIPPEGRQVPCMLKEGSSIINPVLVFERANVGHNYNYVYIPDFGRRYFVNDVVYEGARIYYYCLCDVLASAKSQIGDSNAYVLRAANRFNGTIIDQYYPTTTQIDQQVVYLGDPWLSYNYSQDRGFWSVGVVNSDGVTYYGFTRDQLDAFMAYLWSDDFVCDVLNILPAELALNKPLKASVDPISYLTSCVWLPFSAFNKVPQTPVPWFTATTVTVANIQTDLAAYGITKGAAGDGIVRVVDYRTTTIPHPQSTERGVFLNSPGFTDCRVVFPPFGSYEYNALECHNYGEIEIEVFVDCTNGIGKLIVTGWDSPGSQHARLSILTEAQAQVGVPMPITQIITPGLSVIGMAAQIGAALGAAYAGRMDKAIAGGIGAMDSYYQAKVPKASSVGSRGSLAALEGGAWFEYVFKYVADDDIIDHGRPLCAIKKLSEVPGYQMILEPHIHTTLTATEDDQINAYLAGGYFYE